MNIKFVVSLLITSFLLLPIQVQAKAVAPPNLDRRINDLSNRFSSLEASWGRYQIGGTLNLDFNSQMKTKTAKLEVPEINQQLNLYFDAFIDSNLQLSLRLAHQGDWGSDAVVVNRLNSPLWIDEAFLRMENPHNRNYLGRFKYTLGAQGLIADFSSDYPVEGFVVQQSLGDLHLVALYSRFNTQYNPDNGRVISGEDFWAARIGWSDQEQVFGLNLVPNGVGNQKSFSLDWSSAVGNGKVTAEMGWYYFRSPSYPDLQANWSPGLLLSYEKRLANSNFYQLKLGYFTNDFRPTNSITYHSLTDTERWFIADSQGAELFTQYNFSKNYSLDNRVIVLAPVEKIEDFSKPGYRFRGSIARHFSTFNQIQAGIDVIKLPFLKDNLLFLSWQLQF